MKCLGHTMVYDFRIKKIYISKNMFISIMNKLVISGLQKK